MFSMEKIGIIQDLLIDRNILDAFFTLLKKKISKSYRLYGQQKILTVDS